MVTNRVLVMPSNDGSDTPISLYSLQSIPLGNSKEQFKKMIRETVLEVIEEMMIDQNNKDESFMSIKESCTYLGISRSTLYRWSKDGCVNKYYINGLPRYKRYELEQRAIRLEIRK